MVAFGDSNAKHHAKSPGEVPGVGKMSHEVAKLKQELANRTVPELKMALERQKKIVGNKMLVSRLPDKGEKARASIVAIEKLLESREKEQDLAVQMEALKINTEKMEWKNRLLDSDDDSDPEGECRDPLQVLAQGLVPASSSRARLQEEKGSEGQQEELEKFALSQAERVDDHVKAKERFTPHNSVKQSALDSSLRARLGAGSSPASSEDGRSSPRPSTPMMPLPPAYSCKVMPLTLGESLRLQQEQERRVRQVQEKQARLRLTAARRIGGEQEVVQGRFMDHRGKEEVSEGEDDSGDEGVGVVGVTGVPEEEQE